MPGNGIFKPEDKRPEKAPELKAWRSGDKSYSQNPADSLIGDPTLFMRADMVEQTWRSVQPLLDTWAKTSAADLAIYPAGSAGPSDADVLLAKDGRRWRGIGGDHDGQSS